MHIRKRVPFQLTGLIMYGYYNYPYMGGSGESGISWSWQMTLADEGQEMHTCEAEFFYPEEDEYAGGEPHRCSQAFVDVYRILFGSQKSVPDTATLVNWS